MTFILPEESFCVEIFGFIIIFGASYFNSSEVPAVDGTTLLR
jgi:hypothetical protein